MNKNYDGYTESILKKINKVFLCWSIFILFFEIVCWFYEFWEFRDFNDVINFLGSLTLHYVLVQIIPFIIYLLVRFIVKKNLQNVELNVKEDNFLDYFRECLDLPIPILNALYNYQLNDCAISAILVDLEHKEYIDCSGDFIKIVEKDYSNHSITEKLVLSLLSSSTSYESFKEKLTHDLLNVVYRLGYFKKMNGIPKTCVISCSIFIFTLLLAHYSDIDYDYSFWYDIVNRVSFLFCIVSLIIYKYRKKVPYIKSEKGTDIYYKLMALKNYINDFGNLDNLPVEVLNYRGQFYLYSVMFGNNEEITNNYINKLKNTF